MGVIVFRNIGDFQVETLWFLNDLVQMKESSNSCISAARIEGEIQDYQSGRPEPINTKLYKIKI